MKIVFLGGLSRAGKAAFWPLLSCIKGLDQPQNLPMLDWLNDALQAGDIDEKTFLKLIKLEIQLESWFSYIGRYLNSNKNDLTNFVRLVSEKEYYSRIARTDTEAEYINFRNACSTHDFIPVFTTDIKLSMKQMDHISSEIINIHIIRNPIRMYNEWLSTNRVLRTQKIEGRIIKYKVQDITNSVEDTTARIILKDFKSFYGDKNTYKFEDLCNNPLTTLHSISETIGSKLNCIEKIKLDDARVPRKLLDCENLKIENSSNLTNSLRLQLISCQKQYFNNT